MSERGVFAIDRGVWDHDYLADPQPFSRREAWIWLLSEAAWKPHRRRIMGRQIELARGQLAASYRFMASKWRWSEARVRRFVSGLISEAMVDAKADAGLTVITICNYNKYQRVSLPDDAMPESDVDAGATQERRKVEDKEYKELDGGGEARGQGLVSPEAWSISDELAVIAGHSADPKGHPPGWHGAPMRVQAWLNEGWGREIILIGAKAAMARKRDGPPHSVNYFEPAIARALADQSKPVPTASPRPNHATPLDNSFQGALARLGSTAASLRASASPGSGEDAPRLLSHGRGERS